MRGFLTACFLCFSTLAWGQAQPKLTNPHPILITTGLTFQQLYPAGQGKQSLTVENNNTTATENCWLLIGGPWVAGDTTSSTRTVQGISVTAAQGAVLLPPNGGSYTRYYPLVPSDQILATCTSTSDSLYSDSQ